MFRIFQFFPAVFFISKSASSKIVFFAIDCSPNLRFSILMSSTCSSNPSCAMEISPISKLTFLIFESFFSREIFKISSTISFANKKSCKNLDSRIKP